ncbi:DUF4188 domain-containing protein [Oceanobacillus halotolerans]|uniref:DUF4188 domain-containing protein n=1 Tax=Oceanobacillus halotolerans TaxID=2663380 RepID=UPI0013DA6A4C|nr:DUF4188 domain-containing protein [Oceanobacillus halotolerans]
MGKNVFPGRYTAEQDGQLVVFLIGMRVNKLWAIHKWFPVFMAMPAMIRELYGNRELGFRSVETFFKPRTILMVQYWCSEEELLSYSKQTKHVAAWRKFNQKVGNNDAVGIYHETYILTSKNYEAIYANMPVFGLAKATEHKRITPSRNSARKRLDL